MAAAKKKSWSVALEQLAAAPMQRAEAGPLLREVLAGGDGAAIVLAAKLIEQHALDGYHDALAAAYSALAGARIAADPDCLAKEAVLAALDATGSHQAELFAEAARYVQRTRSKSQARDVAGRVRARGVLGIARLGHVDALALFGGALCDAESNVRLSAARALAHRGARDGAGLLILKLGVGDSEPEIEVECLRALFTVASDLAVREARRLLEAGSRAREQALSALGTASSDDAVVLLEETLEKTPLSSDRAAVIRTMGLSLRPVARALLLTLVTGEQASDALVALEALAIHRYDTRLAAQVHEAVRDSGLLSQRAAELF
jgi:hypothetical protein